MSINTLGKYYIDKDNIENGILIARDYSENEKIFEGKVSELAKWQDGSRVTAAEAAYGIVKGFKYRDIDALVTVENITKETTFNEFLKNKNIEIISDYHFRIKFKTEIKNSFGVINEVLSSGSSTNKVWPVRNVENKFDIVSKYPIKYINNEYYLYPFGKQIKLNNISNCEHNDFYTLNIIADKLNLNSSEYAFHKSKIIQTFIGMFNSNSKNIKTSEERIQIASILRSIAKSYENIDKYHVTPGHFDFNEPGYSKESKWKDDDVRFPKGIKHINIVLYNNTFKYYSWIKKFKERAKESGVIINLIENNSKNAIKYDADIIIISERVHNERQIWIQNLEKQELYKVYLGNFTKTKNAANYIAMASSSTEPLNATHLKNFEDSCYSEASIIPIFRSNLHTYSKLDAPLFVKYLDTKEMIFEMKETSK